MAQDTMSSRPSLVTEQPLPQDRSRALQIVAKSVYKELRSQGFGHSDVVEFASAVVGLISEDIRSSTGSEADS